MLAMQFFTLLLVASVAATENGHKGGPERGDDSIIEHKFVCPYNGFITGVNYRSSAKVHQIQFICISAMGNTTFGPYGGSNGKPGSISCPPKHYISSFYGSNTTTLNRLGIRCRHQGDLYSDGTLVGEFGEEIGTNFDELGLSIGAKPESVTVKTINNSDVYAIQVSYNKILKQHLAPDCNAEWSPDHGGSYSGQNVDEFECPDDGAIFKIEYTYSRRTDGIFSLQFWCKSSQNVTISKRYGSLGPESEVIDCHIDQHISYILGTSSDVLYQIDGECVKSGAFNIKKQEEAAFDIDGGGRVKVVASERTGAAFNDQCLTENGRRPVKIKILSGVSIFSIAIKYKAIPVERNCKQTGIELVNGSTYPELIGFEVLGTTIGSTCSSRIQQLYLSVLQSNATSTTNSTSSSHTRTDSRSTVADIKTGYFELFSGLGADVGLGTSFISGSNSEWSSGESRTASNANGKSQKTTISYQGASAAVVLGYMQKYRIVSNETKVVHHYTCEGGSTPPTNGALPIYWQSYGHVNFQDYHFPFGNKTCTSALRVCISRIKLDGTLKNLRLFKTDISAKVYDCLRKN